MEELLSMAGNMKVPVENRPGDNDILRVIEAYCAGGGRGGAVRKSVCVCPVWLDMVGEATIAFDWLWNAQCRVLAQLVYRLIALSVAIKQADPSGFWCQLAHLLQVQQAALKNDRNNFVPAKGYCVHGMLQEQGGVRVLEQERSHSRVLHNVLFFLLLIFFTSSAVPIPFPLPRTHVPLGLHTHVAGSVVFMPSFSLLGEQVRYGVGRVGLAHTDRGQCCNFSFPL